jgi:beta-lactamase regulating signal transducer with metallopeptidase domain
MSGFAVIWLSRGESLALGWTLLHFCWQGTAVAVAFAVADQLTRRARSGARYSLALCALGLMPLIVLATFAGELRTMTTVHSRASGGEAVQAKVDPLLVLPVIRQYSLAMISGVQDRRGLLASHAEEMLILLDGIWMLGVLLLAIRATGGWWQLESLRKSATGVVPAHLEQRFLLICNRLNVGRHVLLKVSDQVISPMAMGLFRATVILPMSAVLRLTAEELEAVLAHELGHIRRWDYACNLLQTALETVLFFHPAVWWLSRTVRDRREICCDEIAVQSCTDPVVYAQTLLRLEEQKLRNSQLAVALNGRRGTLLSRIERVLGEGEPMENRISSGVRLIVASAVLLALLFGPRVRHAVAASRPALDHAVAMLPAVASSKIQNTIQDAQQSSTATPAPKPVAGSFNAASKVEADAESGANENEASKANSQDSTDSSSAQAESTKHSKGTSYIDGMRDAGYPLDLHNDLNALISMKSLGVTPEYAKAMGALGFGKPSVQELISMKALGVTPEYLSEMKMSGLGPRDFHEATTEKALGITADYAAGMKAAGFGDMNVHELVSLKAQGVTPEYVGRLKQQFPQITLDQLRRAAVFHIDEAFLAKARSHGFDDKDLDKLLRLKISGLLDD